MVLRLRRAARIASGSVAAIGGVVCIGWILGVRTLPPLYPALASMKLNTALALIALGLALRFSIDHPGGSRTTRVLGGCATAIAAATLAEYALGLSLGIDELLLRDPATLVAPGRMSTATAACTLLLGAAVLWLESKWAEWIGLLVALLAHVALLGGLYGVRDLGAIGPYAPVELPTASACYLLALAVVVARPERGVMKLVVSDSSGGLLARRLAPAAIVLPPLLALLRQWGQQAGLYGQGSGRALLVASSSVIFVSLIWWTASALARSDRQHHAAEEAIRKDEAEARAELVRSNDRLRVLAGVSDALAVVATTYQGLLDKIARISADLIGDGCFVTLISDDGERLVNAANAHRDPQLELDYKTHLAGIEVSTRTSSSVYATVIRTEQPVRADVDPTTMVAGTDDALKPIVARLNVHSLAVVPIRAHQAVIGTLSLLRNQPGRSYTDDDATLLQDLADRAGLAIENARLYGELEQRVRARTAELEAANKELEAFSYSVAHDLRAPMRAISGFSHALAEDYPDRLGTEGLAYVTRIKDAAVHMGQVVEGLLHLTYISRTALRRQRVDVTALANTVLARLQAAEPEREVEIVIEPGLVAYADRRLFEIALTNLLGNAWKFTGKRTQARIELSTIPGARPTTYAVRDNGAGFEPAHAERLFAAFQRLHAGNEFEGTGIGLATVQRIIQSHGGRIWADGEVDRGATFYFTLESDPR